MDGMFKHNSRSFIGHIAISIIFRKGWEYHLEQKVALTSFSYIIAPTKITMLLTCYTNKPLPLCNFQ